ncbi:4110_t:CDS:2 [Ambispora leptoticha]|uniref:4110_t:CDS:1 n=1 Tax=Ambispora leptoticha TaxID=144679 RepID=A0A9N8YW31_9GLOM|nr:4110_t:CDS:2 [Ambispora leptoticha]
MTRKIIVTGISPTASEKTVKDFFLFCGKIKEFELFKDETSDKQIAYITFERENAAKTALMLTAAVIGDSQITVRSADDPTTNGVDEVYDAEEISQEEKPKSAIFAEILAAGYQLSDHIIEKGLEYDRTYGISQRVKQWLQAITTNLWKWDAKYKVYETITEKATEIDVKFAVQDKVKSTAAYAQDRATVALQTPIGKRVADFYTSTTKTVADVHFEARQLANDKKTQRESSGSIEAIEVAAQ